MGGKGHARTRTHTRTLTPAAGDSSPCGRAAVLWSRPLPRGGTSGGTTRSPLCRRPRAQRAGHWDRRPLTHLGPEIKSFGPRAETQQISGPLELAAQQTTAAASPDAALVAEGGGGGMGSGVCCLRADPEGLRGPSVEAGERPGLLQLLSPQSGLGAGQQCGCSGPAHPP